MKQHTTPPPQVLCIGGLDPSGGAGLLADAEAVRAAGGRPLAAATAITVQTQRGVSQVVPLPVALVIDQVEQLFADETPAALKLGMLASRSIAQALARLLSKRLGRCPMVIDPVVRSTGGALLFEGNPRRDYLALFALARAVTPNLSEAELLLERSIGSTPGEREAAARQLVRQLGAAIVLKGGHFEGDADDLVMTGGRPVWLRGKRLSGSGRGTGCRFASALAARLALGDDLVVAARTAQVQVRRYLAGPRDS